MGKEFVVIKHKDLTNEYLDEIIRLKQQHWNYSYESQKDWIISNLKNTDWHLLLKLDDIYVAYLSISNIEMIVEDQELVGKGLGNVCVDQNYQKSGLGRMIVEKANEIIKKYDDIGILLCHTHLIPFYESCGWSETKYDVLKICDGMFNDVMMTFNLGLEKVSYMKLERNF